MKIAINQAVKTLSAYSSCRRRVKNGVFCGKLVKNGIGSDSSILLDTGEYYYGQFLKNTISGFGIIVLRNGCMIKGSFLEGKKQINFGQVHGLGQIEFANQEIIRGFFSQGKLKGRFLKKKVGVNEWKWKESLQESTFGNSEDFSRRSEEKTLNASSHDLNYVDTILSQQLRYYQIQKEEATIIVGQRQLGLIIDRSKDSPNIQIGFFNEQMNLDGRGRVHLPGQDCFDGYFRDSYFHGRGVYSTGTDSTWIAGQFIHNKVSQAFRQGQGFPPPLFRDIFNEEEEEQIIIGDNLLQIECTPLSTRLQFKCLISKASPIPESIQVMKQLMSRSDSGPKLPERSKSTKKIDLIVEDKKNDFVSPRQTSNEKSSSESTDKKEIDLSGKQQKENIPKSSINLTKLSIFKTPKKNNSEESKNNGEKSMNNPLGATLDLPITMKDNPRNKPEDIQKEINLMIQQTVKLSHEAIEALDIDINIFSNLENKPQSSEQTRQSTDNQQEQSKLQCTGSSFFSSAKNKISISTAEKNSSDQKERKSILNAVSGNSFLILHTPSSIPTTGAASTSANSPPSIGNLKTLVKENNLETEKNYLDSSKKFSNSLRSQKKENIKQMENSCKKQQSYLQQKLSPKSRENSPKIDASTTNKEDQQIPSSSVKYINKLSVKNNKNNQKDQSTSQEMLKKKKKQQELFFDNLNKHNNAQNEEQKNLEQTQKKQIQLENEQQITDNQGVEGKQQRTINDTNVSNKPSNQQQKRKNQNFQQYQIFSNQIQHIHNLISHNFSRKSITKTNNQSNNSNASSRGHSKQPSNSRQNSTNKKYFSSKDYLESNFSFRLKDLPRMNEEKEKELIHKQNGLSQEDLKQKNEIFAQTNNLKKNQLISENDKENKSISRQKSRNNNSNPRQQDRTPSQTKEEKLVGQSQKKLQYQQEKEGYLKISQQSFEQSSKSKKQNNSREAQLIEDQLAESMNNITPLSSQIIDQDFTSINLQDKSKNQFSSPQSITSNPLTFSNNLEQSLSSPAMWDISPKMDLVPQSNSSGNYPQIKKNNSSANENNIQDPINKFSIFQRTPSAPSSNQQKPNNLKQRKTHEIVTNSSNLSGLSSNTNNIVNGKSYPNNQSLNLGQSNSRKNQNLNINILNSDIVEGVHEIFQSNHTHLFTKMHRNSQHLVSTEQQIDIPIPVKGQSLERASNEKSVKGSQSPSEKIKSKKKIDVIALSIALFSSNRQKNSSPSRIVYK